MRDESLVTKILIFVMAFTFSACQKSAAENVSISPSTLISPTPTVTPNLDSPIRKIDFENFTYPWNRENFILKNGERPFVMKGQMGVSFAKAEYGDLTNDGAEEAFIKLNLQTGGSSMPNVIYVYTLENKKPKVLWSFTTGDRARGGFKEIFAENGELIVETFGDNKFENGEWKFDYPKDKFKGDCCPTVYTRIRFKWNGKKFVVAGTPELFDYDYQNSNK
jgi:hypothetical protein